MSGTHITQESWGSNGGDRGDSRSPRASLEIDTDALRGPVAPEVGTSFTLGVPS